MEENFIGRCVRRQDVIVFSIYQGPKLLTVHLPVDEVNALLDLIDFRMPRHREACAGQGIYRKGPINLKLICKARTSDNAKTLSTKTLSGLATAYAIENEQAARIGLRKRLAKVANMAQKAIKKASRLPFPNPDSDVFAFLFQPKRQRESTAVGGKPNDVAVRHPESP
jgi:hypothetical protein